MIVSVTERPVIKRCPRKWHLTSSNRLALMPMVPATALSLGSFVHAALAEWHATPAKHPKITFLETARDERIRIATAYKAQNGYSIDEAKLLKIDDAITLGYSMVENYATRWGAPLPPRFRLIAPEQTVVLPIPGSEHKEEWLWVPTPDAKERAPSLTAGEMRRFVYDTPRPHYLKGKLDAIIMDENERLYVLERKTYAQRPREEVLRSTDQFVAYQWLLSGLNLGYEVAGVAYDGLWKRAAVPKTVDGRAGTLNDLFCRIKIEHPPEVMAEFEEFLQLELDYMASNPYIYTNRTSDGSCFWGCDMETLCAAMSRGEDVDYVLKTEYTHKPPSEPDADKTWD